MISQERTRKKKEISDYVEELIEAKIEQAEIRFKSSKDWVFETKESEIIED